MHGHFNLKYDCKSVARMRRILQPVFKYRMFVWEVFRDLIYGDD
jgi:hypothetical protein